GPRGARAAAHRPAVDLGLRALARVPRRGRRHGRKPLLLRDRALRAVRALLVPADLHVSALDHDAPHGDRERPARDPLSPAAAGRRRRRRRPRPPPPPAVRRTGELRQASPRVLAAGAGLLVLILVAAILGFAFGRGGSSFTRTLPGRADVQTLLKGIPQHGNVLGEATAR